MNWTVERLVAFENRVAAAFEAKQIRSPVHLCSDSQAAHLIRIFQDVEPQHWICCTWRNHFHCLLKGVPEEELFQAILDGRSMTYCSKEHRIICSSIVGGVLPIAAGLAMGIKRRQEPGGRVWCFVGDMTSYTGIYKEFHEYCRSQSLPVKIVIEDNDYSTDTPTEEAWGRGKYLPLERYHYNRTRPHVGTGTYISF